MREIPANCRKLVCILQKSPETGIWEIPPRENCVPEYRCSQYPHTGPNKSRYAPEHGGPGPARRPGGHGCGGVPGARIPTAFSKMHFSKILQIFGGLVLGCIKTKFCKKICVRQHFSSRKRSGEPAKRSGGSFFLMKSRS